MTNDEPQHDRDYDVEKHREEHRSTCGDPHARLAAPMTEQPCCATVSLTRLANAHDDLRRLSNAKTTSGRS